jgi:hypothetical protein
MPARTRPRLEPTDDWDHLQLRFDWPEQVGYELIRPVVLFGFTPAERSKQTGHRSPQLPLWELGPEDWQLVLRLPEYAPRRPRRGSTGAQLPLLLPAASASGIP